MYRSLRFTSIIKDIPNFYPGQHLHNRHCFARPLLKNPTTIHTKVRSLYTGRWAWHLCPFVRDGSKPGADELGPAAFGAEGLLCPVPPETHEMQEGQLAQLPGLQAWETRLGLLRTPGVSVHRRVKVDTYEFSLSCIGLSLDSDPF